VIAADGIQSTLQKYVVEPSPDLRSGTLEQRKEIASSANLRKWLYDYDVEKAAVPSLDESRTAAHA
jgi:hypothetical protein